jgi:hypothetical protein
VPADHGRELVRTTASGARPWRPLNGKLVLDAGQLVAKLPDGRYAQGEAVERKVRADSMTNRFKIDRR